MKINQRGRECRTYGHHWRPFGADKVGAYFYQKLACYDCGAERTDKITSVGKTIHRQYYYPPGFKYENGQAPSRQELKIADLEKSRRNLRAV